MLMLPTTHTFFLVAYGIHLLQEVFMYTIQYTYTLHTAGIFIQSMGARKRGGIGLLYTARWQN
jgi:hypothetical protein